MFIKIKDLALRKLPFDETFAPGTIDLGPDVEQKSALRTEGGAGVITEHRGGKDVVEDIRLVGKFSTEVTVPCARCLEPVDQSVAEEFDLLYRPLGVDARGDDDSIGRAEAEIGYYQGEGLLLEDTLKEQILLAFPLNLLSPPTSKRYFPH